MHLRSHYWLLPVLVLCACGSPRPVEDKYVSVNMEVKGPIQLPANDAGELATFTPADIVQGKQLFTSNCQACHVGGVTTPNPKVSLALAKLQGATPPRDNIDALVGFIRQPRSYDGKEEAYNCRKTDWLKPKQEQNLAAFVLRAAQRAKGWGTARLEPNQDSMDTPPTPQ
jgi:photosystem II cytochrome c550